VNTNITYNNGSIGCNNTLSHLTNNVLEYVMTKLMVTDFPYIKANNNSVSNRKSTHGVGVNDSNYQTQPTVNGKKVTCPFYTAWTGMMRRCYSEKYQLKNPTYIGCTVDPVWHSFMVFRSWMIKQDWKEKQLDKDILIPGNKVYSPDTCVFVSCQINSLLTDSAACRGRYHMGVTWLKARGKFHARIKYYGKQNHLGYFDTEEAAYAVARKAKAEHITNIAQTQLEPIRSALLHHARLFSDGCNEKIKHI